MDQLRATIDALSVDAKVLFLRTHNEEFRAHVRSAQRDLAEATSLLDRRHTASVHILWMAVIDATVKAASLRLQMVEFALRAGEPAAAISAGPQAIANLPKRSRE